MENTTEATKTTTDLADSLIRASCLLLEACRQFGQASQWRPGREEWENNWDSPKARAASWEAYNFAIELQNSMATATDRAAMAAMFSGQD
ncbi:MAG: hypothetical protein HQL56_01225 [Magnetococcales bacterium]|nr:hypothetical protein [Magnetococcales bacterium]